MEDDTKCVPFGRLHMPQSDKEQTIYIEAVDWKELSAHCKITME